MQGCARTSSNRGRRQCLAAWVLLWAAALGAGGAPPAQAEGKADSPASAQRVKAAFLYKFLGYAEFPPAAYASADSPLVIGVVGADGLAAGLARTVGGRQVNGRAIEVRVLCEAALAAPVHLLFIAGADCGRTGRLVRAASGALLVVTECDGGLQEGSAINLRIVGERVRFDVALDAAQRNGIKLSSRLLAVASHVRKGARQ